MKNEKKLLVLCSSPGLFGLSKKTLDAFAVQARGSGFPRKGTVLLCSSDQKSPSLLLLNESCTMFSYALLDVLRNGDPHRPHQLSLRDLKELAEDRLAALPEKNAPRPSLHSPDQSEGDAADIPFFPNPGNLAAERGGIDGELGKSVAGTILLKYKGHGDAWSAFAWSPDSEYLVVGTYAGELQLWSAVGWGLIHTWEGHNEPVMTVAWSPDGRSVATCSWDKTVHFWEASTGRHLLTYTGHKDGVRSVSWALDGRRIASGSLDKTVHVWDANTGRCFLIYKHHGGTVMAVSWSTDGRKIASAAVGKGQTAQVWDGSTGRCLVVYKRHRDGVRDVRWSPSDSRVISVGEDETVQVWDSNTGQHLFTTQGHLAAWSSDGRTVASVSGMDESVKIWEASTGQIRFTYTGHKIPGWNLERVEMVVWSSDPRIAQRDVTSSEPA